MACTAGLREFIMDRDFDLLIEIYPLVPFPPSVRVGFSRYTLGLSGWTPPTGADARWGVQREITGVNKRGENGQAG